MDILRSNQSSSNVITRHLPKSHETTVDVDVVIRNLGMMINAIELNRKIVTFNIDWTVNDISIPKSNRTIRKTNNVKPDDTKGNRLSISNSGRYNAQFESGKGFVSLIRMPVDINCDSVRFSLYDENNVEKNYQIVKKNRNHFVYDLRQEAPGSYKLQVMIPKVSDGKNFSSWLSKLPVTIARNGMVYFEKAPVYEANVKYFNDLKTDAATLEKYKLVPSGKNNDIIKKAKEITKYCRDDFSKVLAVHDWIASNIYYDMDSYLSKKIDYSKLAVASQVFVRKLSVCSGYSDLAVVMLRSLGIPAYSQSCFALGASTEGKWTDENVNHKSNHAFTMVYLENRWMVMDITWDSHNKFQNGSFSKGDRISHRYFDPTLNYFSNSHKLCG